MGTDKLKSWRDSLISDNTNLLIDASRRCLGPIKTPFNKHELASGLEAYLRKPQTAEMIINMLDSTDLRILALIRHTGFISADTLAYFAAEKQEKTSIENSKARVNALRERLIVYTHSGGPVPNAILINPILEEKLKAELPLSRLVTKIKHLDPVDSDCDFFTDLCSFMSVAVHTKPFFGKSSSLSKKAAERFYATAPHVAGDSSEYLATLHGTLLNSGCLAETESDKALPRPRIFLDICEAFGQRSELAFLAANEAIHTDIFSVEFLITLFSAVLKAFPKAVRFSNADAERMIFVIIYPLVFSCALERKTSFDFLMSPLVHSLLETLKSARLLEPHETGFIASSNMVRMSERQDSVALGEKPTAVNTPKVIIEDSHEIRILPEANHAERACVSILSRMDKTGLVWNSTLDKEAALSAFAFGFAAEELCSTLERLSGRKLSQSTLFSLQSWEKEYNAVRLRSGVVVLLDDHLSLVLEHNPKAEGLVREKLANGVFLVDAINLADAERKLRKLGIHADLRGTEPEENMAENGRIRRISHKDIFHGTSSPMPKTALKPVENFVLQDDALVDADKRASETVSKLLGILRSLKLDPSLEEMLSDRVKSRLITSEDQMLNNELAGGIKVGALDYPGKVRLVERAYKEGTPIEVVWPGERGMPSQAKGIVRQMNRSESGLELVLVTSTGPSDMENSITLPIRSLSGVRIIQNFLFGETNGTTPKD